MQKTGEINLTLLGIQDNNPDIGIMIERDGYVFCWSKPDGGRLDKPLRITNKQM